MLYCLRSEDAGTYTCKAVNIAGEDSVNMDLIVQGMFCRFRVNMDLIVQGMFFRFRVMVLDTIFNNISVISWRSVLLVEETGVPVENHQPVASH